MTADIVNKNPETDVVSMEIVSTGQRINRWVEYSFGSNFLTPTDSFTFTVAGDIVNTVNRTALVPGAMVRCTVNGSQQVEARIDDIEYNVNRAGGVELVIVGRDRLAPLVDSGIDPTLKFNKGQNLLDFMTEIFQPFGFDADSFVIDNSDNVGVLSKNVKGIKTRRSDVGGAAGLLPGAPTKKASKGVGKPIRDVTLHQLRPYPNEGAWDFITRVCHRLGLWVWLAGDGKKIVVSKPNYDQSTSYTLRREFGGQNDILTGSVKLNMGDQPSIIFADGFSGGTEYGHSRIKAFAINPSIDADNSAILKKYAKRGFVKVDIPFNGRALKSDVPRAIFLHDDEAKEQVHIENFLRKEMALRLHKSLTCRPTVRGHAKDGHNWTVDTMCHFIDNVSGLDEDLYVLGRTFMKSRNGGTTTQLDLIRPHSLSL